MSTLVDAEVFTGLRDFIVDARCLLASFDFETSATSKIEN